MNYTRLALASVAAFVAYMVLGGLIFGAIPSLKDEFLRYPNVYRSQQGQMSHMPTGMAAMLLSMVVLAVLYAKMFQGGSGVAEGAIFGALIGLYAIGSFVLHNYVNLNIGLKITVVSAIAYFVEWTVVGIVIGLVYKPASA
jgi:Protein of unknown function (DUF1761)